MRCSLVLLVAAACCGQLVSWKHISSATGDLPAPNPGRQQTASVVCDFDRDGINDFAVAERTAAPAVVWYRRGASGWTRYLLEAEPLRVEAGGACADIDEHGDLDLTLGGDARSNEVWWWENPYPAFDPTRPWKRRAIKSGGANKHHDQIFGGFDHHESRIADLDGDGRLDILGKPYNHQTPRLDVWLHLHQTPRLDVWLHLAAGK